ncbi:right-handed parallel beta-helix repeat-containing protein [Kribbella sp. NPDC056861]|uniref:right-handed parallel beta-helix repeat-containing protein n=1 Tax=Kribbella sp. NPDC056861 TaxID=3154857 RepID=UPI0034450F4E
MKKSVTIICVAAAGAVAITGIVAGTRTNMASAFGEEKSGILPGDRPHKPWPPRHTPRPTVSVSTTPTPTPTVTKPTETPTTKPTPTPTPTPTETPTSTPKPTTPAPGTFPAGPSQAPECKGTTIGTDQNAADVIDKAAAGTTFCFASGVHRIDRTLKPKPNTTLGSDDGAVLTGSVPLTSWTADNGDWVTRGALPAAYGMTGQCEDNAANICHLREQVFLNGKHLTRVKTRDKVAAGTFYADYAGNAVYLGDNPAGQSVEMSKTATAIQSNATNVAVVGLTVEHFASVPQAGAVVLGTGWRVFANDIRWNHAVGAMLVNADGATLDRNLIQYNGQLGVGQYSTANGKIVGNQVSNNNTDGFWIADWESGGIKTTWSTNGSVSGNLIKANRGVGLWSDAYDDGRVFSDNQIVDNAADGIRYEIGRNGTIENNTITGNGLGTGRGSGTSLWDGGGINVNTSTNVTVRNNTLAGNVNGISIQSRTRGNGPWGLNVLRGVIVSGNKVTMRGGTTSTGLVQNSGAAIPTGEVVLKGNTYVLDSLTADRFQKFGQWFSAAEWKATGLDLDSQFKTG